MGLIDNEVVADFTKLWLRRAKRPRQSWDTRYVRCTEKDLGKDEGLCCELFQGLGEQRVPPFHCFPWQREEPPGQFSVDLEMAKCCSPLLVPVLGRTEGTGSCLNTSLVAVLLLVLERRMLLLG